MEIPVNEHIRRRIRRLREQRKLSLREAARLAGFPYSSYANMENGDYRISVDHLYRILLALETDIEDVWPLTLANSALNESRLHLMRLYEFRINELVHLTGAGGAALFGVRRRQCKVLLCTGLSDTLAARCRRLLEMGRVYPEGIWLFKQRGDRSFHLLLKTTRCQPFLRQLADAYLDGWARFFAAK